MPLSTEDRFFGGKKGAAEKAHAAIIKQYGMAEGTRIFYALLNKRKARMRRGSRSGT